LKIEGHKEILPKIMPFSAEIYFMATIELKKSHIFLARRPCGSSNQALRIVIW
jgi:hypothetical protein